MVSRRTFDHPLFKKIRCKTQYFKLLIDVQSAQQSQKEANGLFLLQKKYFFILFTTVLQRSIKSRQSPVQRELGALFNYL